MGLQAIDQFADVVCAGPGTRDIQNILLKIGLKSTVPILGSKFSFQNSLIKLGMKSIVPILGFKIPILNLCNISSIC